jgi:hypothetical protein
MKRMIVAALLLLGSCVARSAPITDVVLQQWRYDAQSQTVTVPLCGRPTTVSRNTRTFTELRMAIANG